MNEKTSTTTETTNALATFSPCTTFYHANEKWTGCAASFELIPAQYTSPVSVTHISKTLRMKSQRRCGGKMFDVLPPCSYTRTSRYEMFYVSEAFHLTYHSFYLYDRHTGKYWTKLCDSCDRTTWIDFALGLRAA